MDSELGNKKYNYPQVFGINNPNSKITEKALNRAWKNRDFEINLYWKRSNYFWLFITTIYVAFYNFYEKSFLISLLLIIVGFIFSTVWCVVLQASKYWQENWEKHIDVLEDKITGPIYKSIIKKESDVTQSVTKCNYLIARVILYSWPVSFVILYVRKRLLVQFDFNYLMDYAFKDYKVAELTLLILVSVLGSFGIYHLITRNKLETSKSKKEDYQFKLRDAVYSQDEL